MATAQQIEFLRQLDSSLGIKDANEIANEIQAGNLESIVLPARYVEQVMNAFMTNEVPDPVWDWTYGLIAPSPFGDAACHPVQGWRFRNRVEIG